MSSTAHPRNGPETRARIIDAAQRVFAEKGYSAAGLREIAKDAGVVSSLIVKYYLTKANLFEEALVASLSENQLLPDKTGFGEKLVQSVLNPGMNITAPAMIALSLGDEEARMVAAKVARERILKPVSEWIGGTHGQARAEITLLLSVGFAIFHRYMETLESPEQRTVVQEWIANTIQRTVENDDGASAFD
ncbi:TetR family transcriptional regulator [Blastomonas sp.]|uniref:TetR family transcriptional regulator n=1 Tax=Blastomonas sp. TaxID=1909299 RepID=UPI00391A37BE